MEDGRESEGAADSLMSQRISRRTAMSMLTSAPLVVGQARRVFAHPAGSAISDGLPRAAPEAEGLEPERVLAFLDDVRSSRLELHSFMLARRGRVLAEGWWSPYRADLRHMMHSLTKSVTACAVGLALQEGRFHLNDSVVSFFPDELPRTVSDNLRAMTVEHLLSMRTGHDHMVSGAEWRGIQTSWVAEFFKIPVVYPPGSRFVYTSAATYMLSAIISKTTGLSTHEYLRPRVLDPLAIHDEDWPPGPEGITPGANGLSWRTADSLKLGLLHASDGIWRGQRLLPASWVESVQQPHGSAEYGYQWWLGPAGAYYADGLFGQLSIVFPHIEAVLAITSAVQNEDALLATVWKHFPVAFTQDAARPQQAADANLRRLTSRLSLFAPLLAGSSPLSQQVSGRQYTIAANDDGVTAITLAFAADRCLFTLADASGVHSVNCGLGKLIEGNTTIPGHKLHHEYRPSVMRVAAAGEWLDSNTFQMVWQFIETAFRDTATVRFEGDRLTFDRSVNVNSEALSLPTLDGRTGA